MWWSTEWCKKNGYQLHWKRKFAKDCPDNDICDADLESLILSANDYFNYLSLQSREDAKDPKNHLLMVSSSLEGVTFAIIMSISNPLPPLTRLLFNCLMPPFDRINVIWGIQTILILPLTYTKKCGHSCTHIMLWFIYEH